MVPKKQEPPAYEDSAVVSFRAPRKLVKELDALALGDQRTRANLMVKILTDAITLEPGIQVVERIIPALCREHEKNPDSPQAESHRGEMRGARAVLEAFFGKRAMRRVDQRARERAKLPMPHVIPLDQDGNRYGFDSEADLY